MGDAGVWYNDSEQRSEAFHLKCAVEPAAYLGYLDSCGLSHRVHRGVEEELRHRFTEDFYADKLRAVFHSADGRCIHEDLYIAGTTELLDRVGPVVVSREPCSLAVVEARVATLEQQIVSYFGQCWFSVGIFFDKVEGDIHDRVLVTLGAKVDEKRFASVIYEGDGDAQRQFQERWRYVKTKDRKYWRDHGGWGPHSAKKQKKPACRFFFGPGKWCRNGSSCQFSHSAP